MHRARFLACRLAVVMVQAMLVCPSWAAPADPHIALVEISPVSEGERSHVFAGAVRGAPSFEEDFEGGVIPVGWTVVDLDGLTPSPSVPQFTAAWIAAQDFEDAGNTVAMSTSWYLPTGSSDDWLITPAIALGAFDRLSWRAEAQDVTRRDGYEVRVSTGGATPAECLSNPALFSVENESPDFADRFVDLWPLGYASETVHFCFHNDSTDQFILQLDDIVVRAAPDYDAAILSLSNRFTRVPVGQGPPIPLGATVAALGSQAVTNVVLTAQVELDGEPVITAVAAPIPTLAAGASVVVDLGTYLPRNQGTLTIDYTVAIDETDAIPENDGTALTVLLTGVELARDDGNVSGSLGVGPSVTGEFGVVFPMHRPGTVDRVRFRLVGGNPDLVGQLIAINLRSFPDGGPPGNVIATSNAFLVPNLDAQLAEVEFPGGPVDLSASEFFLGVIEGSADTGLSVANDLFAEGKVWVDWELNPFGDWVTLETFDVRWAPFIRVDITLDADVFAGDFESGDVCFWSQSQAAPACD